MQDSDEIQLLNDEVNAGTNEIKSIEINLNQERIKLTNISNEINNLEITINKKRPYEMPHHINLLEIISHVYIIETKLC
jgi:hypothetical protein